MNKINILLTALFLIILTSCSDDIVNNYSAQYQSKSIEFFDSITNQPAWKKMTMQQKLIYCQLPEDELSDLSTLELVELCAKHPLNPVCNAYDNPMVGARVVMSHFNGFEELKRRNDSSEKLLEFYEGLDFSATKKSPYPISIMGLDGVFYSGSNIAFMELLIASNEISELYDSQHINRLKKIVQSKLQQKIISNAVFGKASIAPTLMVQGRIAIKTSLLSKEDEIKIAKFLDSGGNVENINSIIKILFK